MNQQIWREHYGHNHVRLVPSPDAAQISLPLAPSLERRRLHAYLLLMVADALMIVAASLGAGFLYLADVMAPAAWVQAGLLVPIFWAVALNFEAYSLAALVSPRFGALRAVLSLIVAAGVVVFVAFYTGESARFSREAFALAVGGATGLLVWNRFVLCRFTFWHCGKTALNTLIIDDHGDHLELANAYRISAAEQGLLPDLADPHMLNRIGRYLANMDRVLITCPPSRRWAWSQVLKGAGIQGEVIDRQVRELGAVGAVRGDGFGALVVSTGPLGLRARAAKRLLDLALTIPALILLSPLLGLVALLIKLEDGGPVLFVQRRMGRSNRFFPIYKFRSMRVDRQDRDGHQSASKSDDRITRLGRFIRRTSIDELPQLFNVLKGEMSLVGPRPHALGSLAGSKQFWEVDERYWLRHSLKPGLTGLAQIRGWRGATDTEADLANRLQSDLEYIAGWTVLRDLHIILATVKVLVHDRAF